MARSLKQLVGNNAEAQGVLNDPEKMKLLIYVLQKTTDEFMNRAEVLVNDKRRSVKEKAEVALQIANYILLAEKSARMQELKNISDMMGNRGLNVDSFI